MVQIDDMKKYSWVVVNQSQPPQFQKLLGLLSEELGPGLFLTGVRHDGEHPRLTVVKGPSYVRDSMKTRMKSWAAFTAFASKELARIPGKPFLLSVTNPPMLPHLGILLSRLKGWRTGILVWDLYPNHIVERGWMSARNPVVRGWQVLNRMAYRDASVVITIGEGMAQAIREQARSSELAIAVIPNWADTDVLKPISKKKNGFSHAHCSPDKVTVLYSGNLGASHSLDALLLAAKELSSEVEIEFLIIGEGLSEESLKEKSEELHLQNLTFLPYQPWDTVPYSLAAGDIAVVSQEASTAHLSVPSKVYSALSVGSAILALTSPSSDLGKLVTKHNIGRVCHPDDAEAIAKAILELAGNQTELRAIRTRAREVAEEYFSEYVVRERFLSVLQPHV